MMEADEFRLNVVLGRELRELPPRSSTGVITDQGAHIVVREGTKIVAEWDTRRRPACSCGCEPAAESAPRSGSSRDYEEPSSAGGTNAGVHASAESDHGVLIRPRWPPGTRLII